MGGGGGGGEGALGPCALHLHHDKELIMFIDNNNIAVLYTYLTVSGCFVLQIELRSHCRDENLMERLFK